MGITSIPAGIEVKWGGHLVDPGATFRIWAPNAREVYLIWGNPDGAERPAAEWRLEQQGEHFVGFVTPAQDGDYYRYWIVGPDGEGPKRDPWARELEWQGYPDCDCILRDPTAYPWAPDDRRHRPQPHELVLYQLHVGTFFYQDDAGNDLRRTRVGRFLDVLDRFEHILQLNVNGIQLLPIVEWQTSRSLGYNGTDLFSPEMDHFVPKNELGRYVDLLNRLRAEAGAPALEAALLESGVNQLKALIDLFHLYDIAVFFDVVYNHAGGNFDDQSLRLIDHCATYAKPHGPYFQNAGWAGGVVFDYQSPEVRRFLIENALAMSEEYHIDGIRYDEVTVIDDHGGWRFCQELTDTLSRRAPDLLNVAEFWKGDKSWVIRETGSGGAGFDAVWLDTLRDAIRGAIAAAGRGAHAWVNMSALRSALFPTFGEDKHWATVHYIENHDLHKAGHDDRQPRIARLADGSNSRSWYARGRSRVANALLLTAPGIPMIFMGQEILEDKYWSDNPSYHQGTLVWWSGLSRQPAMREHLRFMQELIKLRRTRPGLTGRYTFPFQVHNNDRVLAILRGTGEGDDDIVVVVSLNESALRDYAVGFPRSGSWNQLLNGDDFEIDPARRADGARASIEANGPAMHAMPASARMVIPANGVLIFGRKPR
jgi:1,4-alpha-glucan branching enzyme